MIEQYLQNFPTQTVIDLGVFVFFTTVTYKIFVYLTGE
jgi:hypothetical protein